MNILGIDIGGTSIKADVYDEDGTFFGTEYQDMP